MESADQKSPRQTMEQIKDKENQLDSRKWWVLLAIGISTFMSALDGSVVNTVLPVIRVALKSQVADVEWVVIIYLLVVSGLLLSFGRLGDLRGHRPVFLGGFFVFIGASVLCSFSSSVGALVTFRGLQALGASSLQANSPAILTKSFPARQRGQALGMQATMTYLGLTVGPTLGGWLTQAFGWRSVFFINVPVGLTAMLLAMRFVPHDEGRTRRESFDVLGASTFMVGLIMLLLGLNRGQEWGWFSAPILLLLTTSALLLAAFVWIENRSPSPMLDLSLFRRRLFSTSVTSAVFNYICVYSITFLMPFYLIDGRNLNPAQAGMLLSAMPVVMAVVAPISGTLSDRIGSRIPATFGMAILAAGLYLTSRLGPQATTAQIVFALAISGLGIGIFISPNNSALMGSAPRNRQGIAAGMLATARNSGMALGVGIAGAVYTTVLARSGGLASGLYLAIKVSFLVATGVAVLGLMTAAIRGEIEAGQISSVETLGQAD